MVAVREEREADRALADVDVLGPGPELGLVVEGERHEAEALRGGGRRGGMLVAGAGGLCDDYAVAALQAVVGRLAVAGEVDGDRRSRREDGGLLERRGRGRAGERAAAGDGGQRDGGDGAADGGGGIHRGLHWEVGLGCS